MKGKLEQKSDTKTWTAGDGKVMKFAEVVVNGKKYTSWQPEKIASLTVGEEIEFEEAEKNGKWKIMIGSKTPFNAPGRPLADPKQAMATMTAAYAKDVLVATIQSDPEVGKDISIQQNIFNTTADYIYAWVSKKMKEG